MNTFPHNLPEGDVQANEFGYASAPSTHPLFASEAGDVCFDAIVKTFTHSNGVPIRPSGSFYSSQEEAPYLNTFAYQNVNAPTQPRHLQQPHNRITNFLHTMTDTTTLGDRTAAVPSTISAQNAVLLGQGLSDQQPPDQAQPDTHLSKRRLACPFQAHDPLTHGRGKACTGDGFVNIAKMKEHLKRCHLAKETNRSGRVSSDGQRQTSDSCRNTGRYRAPPVATLVEYLSEGEWLQIKRRVKDKPEEAKWSDIYRIIWPDSSNNVPLPYACALQPTASSGASDLSMPRPEPQRDLVAFAEHPPDEVAQEVKAHIIAVLSKAAVPDISQKFYESLPPLISIFVKASQERDEVRPRGPLWTPPPDQVMQPTKLYMPLQQSLGGPSPQRSAGNGQLGPFPTNYEGYSGACGDSSRF